MNSLRVLVIGKSCPIAERLQEVGHQVTPVEECRSAVEALQLQRFDAVVLPPDLQPRELTALTQEVQELNRVSSSRTAMVAVLADDMRTHMPAALDGYLPGQATPEALSSALMKLAAGLRISGSFDPNDSELSVLETEELQKQLEFDDDLLLELIDLFSSERERQSHEMREALAAGDLPLLSRLAHTIKGSLGSLHAPAARAEAQVLEIAASERDHALCRQLLPSFERKLDQLCVELLALGRSLTERR